MEIWFNCWIVPKNRKKNHRQDAGKLIRHGGGESGKVWEAGVGVNPALLSR
ncbi:hypothetical protein L21SP2_2203 [Salinispira pacifica]|uniref:Uncharacterized protein n=1 Tax=Salinispira pacifica TaxID=1307761 RepID=V5WK60_9SPIO|nr:hypothetical protein L21SP2_2203 [Salinispira pacifica]